MSHTNVAFNHSCLKMPVNPSSKLPSPTYERNSSTSLVSDTFSTSDLKERNVYTNRSTVHSPVSLQGSRVSVLTEYYERLSKSSSENSVKTKCRGRKQRPRQRKSSRSSSGRSAEITNVDSLKAYKQYRDSIPNYDQVAHLSDKDFYSQVEQLRSQHRKYIKALDDESVQGKDKSKSNVSNWEINNKDHRLKHHHQSVQLQKGNSIRNGVKGTACTLDKRPSSSVKHQGLSSEYRNAEFYLNLMKKNSQSLYPNLEDARRILTNIETPSISAGDCTSERTISTLNHADVSSAIEKVRKAPTPKSKNVNVERELAISQFAGTANDIQFHNMTSMDLCVKGHQNNNIYKTDSSPNVSNGKDCFSRINADVPTNGRPISSPLQNDNSQNGEPSYIGLPVQDVKCRGPHYIGIPKKSNHPEYIRKHLFEELGKLNLCDKNVYLKEDASVSTLQFNVNNPNSNVKSSVSRNSHDENETKCDNSNLPPRIDCSSEDATFEKCFLDNFCCDSVDNFSDRSNSSSLHLSSALPTSPVSKKEFYRNEVWRSPKITVPKPFKMTLSSLQGGSSTRDAPSRKGVEEAREEKNDLRRGKMSAMLSGKASAISCVSASF